MEGDNEEMLMKGKTAIITGSAGVWARPPQ